MEGLLSAIRKASLEGLRPESYHLPALRSLLAEIRHQMRQEGRADPRKLADLDLLLTDSYFGYGTHLLDGRVDPETLDPRWGEGTEEVDLMAHLERSLEEDRVEESLRDLFFAAHPGYFRLRAALAQYRSLLRLGGWPRIPAEDTLRPGDTGELVEALRERLALSGDYRPTEAGDGAESASPTAFDPGLEEAVRRFQGRHGLQDDGVVGPATITAMNVSATERVRQIELNLERWRWLPQELGGRYILVNIAGFRVEVMDFIEPVLEMRAIVGKRYTQTPVFSDTVTYVVFNPIWNVPHSIAVTEIVPRARRDPGYLQREGFRIVSGWGADAREIDPGTIDWSAIRAGGFPYRIYQEPGPRNALGRVKFMFPNEHDVYLHDTPERRLFRQPVREFSHGCIRVEKPIELAVLLLRGNEEWSPQRIDRTIASGRETTVLLPEPLPIHIQYWTAWTEADGTVQFRDDIYGRDRVLAEALAGLDEREASGTEPAPPPAGAGLSPDGVPSEVGLR